MLVNPYSKDEISRRDPQGARHAEGGAGAALAGLNESVAQEDVLAWRKGFVAALAGEQAAAAPASPALV